MGSYAPEYLSGYQAEIYSVKADKAFEWEEFRDDVLFFKWPANELKKGARLVMRQGQKAVFFAGGEVEGGGLPKPLCDTGALPASQACGTCPALPKLPRA